MAPSLRPRTRRGSTRERCDDGLGLLTARTEEREGGWRISIRGELDMASASVLESELLGAEARDSRPIVIDLHEMTFMGVAGLHLLFAATKRARAASRRLTIVRGPTAVQRVFEVTRTETLLPFVPR